TYAYLLDLHQAPTLSSATYGLRGESVIPLGSGFSGRLNAAFAHQNDYANNPLNISLSYYVAEAGAGFGEVTGLVGREEFEGNGTIGFQTPLASPHGFNGFAEVFALNKPANGLVDVYAKASAGLPPLPVAGKFTASLIYHDFNAEHVHQSFGD